MGTDLTVKNDRNKLFHTDAAPDTVNSTAALSHRPWDFVWRVAEGRSSGDGRAKPERWSAYVDRFIRDHLWF